MQRVQGIGGIFVKARDSAALRVWYRDHLGIDVQPWGGTTFRWHDPASPTLEGATVWSVFDADSSYFAPSTAAFMVNYRVADLDAFLVQLRLAGCVVDDKVEASEYGKFGWVMDPEGNRIELWQPPEGALPG